MLIDCCCRWGTSLREFWGSLGESVGDNGEDVFGKLARAITVLVRPSSTKVSSGIKVKAIRAIQVLYCTLHCNIYSGLYLLYCTRCCNLKKVATFSTATAQLGSILCLEQNFRAASTVSVSAMRSRRELQLLCTTKALLRQRCSALKRQRG